MSRRTSTVTLCSRAVRTCATTRPSLLPTSDTGYTHGVLQIVFVSTPSLIYMGHAMHTVRREEKRRSRREEAQGSEGDPGGGQGGRAELHEGGAEKDGTKDKREGRIRLRGALLQTYVLSILIRSIVEVVFLCLQYLLYGIFLNPLYVCKSWPCPHPVNCYVSRPTEKNVFIVFMLVVSAVSLVLSVLELHHLAWKHCCRQMLSEKPKPAEHSLARQLPLSPPPPSTPPPDFSQCVIGSTHFLPLPFPQHGLANQQNSKNMATENNMAAAEENFLQMNCYSPGWDETGARAYLRTEASCFSHPTQTGPDRLLLCPNGEVCHKDKRRFSKTSGTSSRSRADDLSV